MVIGSNLNNSIYTSGGSIGAVFGERNTIPLFSSCSPDKLRSSISFLGGLEDEDDDDEGPGRASMLLFLASVSGLVCSVNSSTHLELFIWQLKGKKISTMRRSKDNLTQSISFAHSRQSAADCSFPFE